MTKNSGQPRQVESLLAETRRRLRRAGLRARKGLGQHFLIDGTVLDQIIDTAQLSPEDTVIEIGPGLGILTEALAERSERVIAVELDRHLAELLPGNLNSDRLAVINDDILNIHPDELAAGEKYKVVANLPYYVASAVVRHFLEADRKPETMVVMVQREVAEQMAARPGRMSLLSIGVQFYGRPEIVAVVPGGSFYPAPEVESAVVKIDVYPAPVIAVTDEAAFFSLVRAGFSAARKQLANSLAQGTGLPKPEVLALMEQAGIPASRRAESLSLEEWAGLWQAFSEAGKLPC
jgi:16S rRNA (adenine1518-N6/adenine1519-N6)-dimethyltransferase